MKRFRRQATDWENNFAKDTAGKGLLFKISKKFLKLNNKEIDHLIKKYTKNLNKRLTKEYIQMTNKHMRRSSTSYYYGNAN